LFQNAKVNLLLSRNPITKPLFVSPGHQVDIEDARLFTIRCCRKFKIPEPLRRAHSLAESGKNQFAKSKKRHKIIAGIGKYNG